MFKKLLSFLFILFSITVKAQAPAHYVIGKEVFDGVHLYSIIQDSDNSIWFSSNKGLYNYNGLSFTHQIPKSSKSTALFGLTKNANGAIFCFNLQGQVYKIVDKKLQLYFTLPNQYLSGRMFIVFDKYNNLFFITDIGVVKVFEDKSIKPYPKSSGNVYTKVNDTLYLGSNLLVKEKNKIGYFNKKGLFVNKSDFCNEPHPTIFCVNNKLYHFWMRKAVFYEDKNNSKKQINYSFLKTKYFRIYNSANDFWFSDHENGVYKITHKEVDTDLNPPKWFKDYYISGVMTDNEGNTWLLTFGKGAIIIPNLEVVYKQKQNGNNFKAIQKSKNELFVSEVKGGIYTFKNNKNSLYFIAKADRVDNFNVFKDKNILVANTGIYKNTKRVKVIHFTRSSFCVGNTLYLASYRGLESYNLDTKVYKQLTKSRTYDILYNNQDGKTWIASSKGLAFFKDNTETVFKYKNKPLTVFKLAKVAKEIWATSKDGVYVFKDSIIDKFTVKKGLLSNQISAIEYEYPYAYLASSKGLQRYNTISKKFTNFTRSNGITKKITDFKVLNDTIYALNSKGLFSFSFNTMDDSIPTYQTKIIDALVDGVKKITDKISLNPNENNVEFTFLTTTFKYQKDLTYQYQLKGYEKRSTIAKENQNFVKYPNLPAGTYTFVVDSFINKQKNKSASITFTIKQNWFETLWFKLLVIGLCLFMIYSIYKVRLNAVLQKRDKELMQKRLAESSLTSLKAQMNPHFLFNAMNSVQSLVLQGKRHEAYEYIAQISDFVRKNLNMSDVAFISFEKEFNFCKMYLELEKLRFEETFTYSITSEVKNENCKVPSMIIQPFLENAVKHGLLHRVNNRKLEVVFKQQNNVITCVVTDNGIGRKASEAINKRRNKSFSTSAIKSRFEILKQYYKIDIGFAYEDLIENDKPMGTRVTIKIPISND